jgi:DNA-binding Xre family transcriptional regulator
MVEIKGKFPNGLDAAMKERGYGSTRLAEEIGSSKQNVTRWANQSRALPPAWADKIAPVLGKTAAELLLVDSAPPERRVELPPRPSRRFHIHEWRVHSEWEIHDLAKAIGVDDATYEFLETYPHKFTIEQIEAIAKKLKVQFDTLRFEPPPKDKPRTTTKTAPQKKIAKR